LWYNYFINIIGQKKSFVPQGYHPPQNTKIKNNSIISSFDQIYQKNNQICQEILEKKTDHNLFKPKFSFPFMKAGRKASGARYKKTKKRKLTGRQSQARIVKIGDQKTKLLSGRGKTSKLVSFLGNIANVIVKGKSKKSAIKNVLETPANAFLARQNVLIKGAIIETELGKAKITNRPSQEGNIQAILVE